MSQLVQIALTLNTLANERKTTPDDVFRAGTVRRDTFERVVERLDAHRRVAVSDARECAYVVAAAQRLKEATDARAAAFRESLIDVMEERCRMVEAEYDALARSPDDTPDALIAAKFAEVKALRREKYRMLQELLTFAGAGENGVGWSNRLAVLGQIDHLVAWTGKTHGAVVYDSKVDPFTEGGLFEKVRGKENIALVATTTEGDVFGGFYSVAVTEQGRDFYDPNVFAFSFESHGRCTMPRRFGVREGLQARAFVRFRKNDSNGFVLFFVGGADSSIRLGNEASKSNCWNLSRGFEGLEDTTLTGKNGTWGKGPYHHCTRLVAVQLS